MSIQIVHLTRFFVPLLPKPQIHRALRVRAAQHGRSAEAEIRDILEQTVKPKGRIKLGSLLADIGQQVKLTDEDFVILEQIRNKAAQVSVSFE